MTARFATPIRPLRAYDKDTGRFKTGECEPLPFPIVLQNRALGAQRTAFLRSVYRVGALLTNDLFIFWLSGATIRSLRAFPYLHERVSVIAQALVPVGVYPRQQLLIAGVLGLAICGSYTRSRWRNTKPVITGFMLALGLVSWSHIWERPTAASVAGFFLTALTVGLLLIIGRQLESNIARRVGASMTGQRTLVVGDAEFARGVRDYEPLHRGAQLPIVGFIDTASRPAPDSLGGISDLVPAIDEHRVEALLLSPRLDDDLFLDILYAADGAAVEAFVIGSAYAAKGFAPSIIVRGTVPLVQLTRPALRAHQLVMKRALDVTASLVVLVLASPLLALVALLVKLTSKGPVLFRQGRVGRGGRVFRIYKFRSMVSDAEQRRADLLARSVYGDERLFKMDSDPRVTRLGAFLRRTSIDELPQLWNVLRGDMALVGPRPPLISEVALYDEQHFARFGMKPGITGPWQVSGRNDVREFDKVITIETAYLSGWNIWKDLDILFRTVPVVMSMRGAR